MQKKIIALAVAGLVSGGAFAQSNVTISGEMKVGFENASAGGSTVVNSNQTSRNRVTDTNSKIKFAGEETLGNGMTAWWQMESAIGTSDNVGTTGAAGNGAPGSTTLGSRNTAVGVKGAFGNFFMGKWDVHYGTVAGGGVDTHGLADGDTLAASSLSILHTNGAVTTVAAPVVAGTNPAAAATGAGRSAANGFGGRFNNVIAYTSPNFSGFAVAIQHSTQSDNTSAALVAKDKAWGFNPTYANGPFNAFYSYFKLSNTGAVVNAGAAAAGDSGNNLTANRLGAAYTLPMGLKFGLIWDKNKIEVADGTASLNGLGVAATGGAVAVHSRRERTAWALPVQYTSGAHRVNFTYATAANVKTDVGTVGDSGAKMYTLGYDYSLSKRTSVALSWTSINNGNNAAYDGWHPSSSVAGSGTLPGLNAGADPRIVYMGLRHSF